MTKITILRENLLFMVVLRKKHKKWTKSEDVSCNLTKSHQVSAASVDYSASSRRKIGEGGKKPPPLRKIGLISCSYEAEINYTIALINTIVNCCLRKQEQTSRGRKQKC